MILRESRSRLPGLWRGAKRVGSVLAMGIAGAIALGPFSFIISPLGFWSFQGGLGGLLTGALAGAVYGWRTPARDAAIVIAVATAILTGVGVYGSQTGRGPFWTTVLALASASIVSRGLAAALPKLVPAQARCVLAIPLALLFVGGLFGAWVWRIYHV